MLTSLPLYSELNNNLSKDAYEPEVTYWLSIYIKIVQRILLSWDDGTCYGN